MDYKTKTVVLCACIFEIQYLTFLWLMMGTNLFRAGIYFAMVIFVSQDNEYTNLAIVKEKKLVVTVSFSALGTNGWIYLLGGLLICSSFLTIGAYLKKSIYYPMRLVTFLSYFCSFLDLCVSSVGFIYCISIVKYIIIIN